MAGTGLRVLLATALGMMGVLSGPRLAAADTAHNDPMAWNQLGSPDGPALAPAVTVSDGLTTATPGQQFTYKFTVDPGLPATDTYIGEQWTNITLCQDSNAPFTRAPQKSDFTPASGNLTGFSVTNLGGGCYEVKLGVEYTYGNYTVNNASYIDGGLAAGDYQPPSSIAISLPATVASSAPVGATVTGTAKVTSGRVAKAWLPVIPPKTLPPVQDYGDGTCLYRDSQSMTNQSPYGAWVDSVDFALAESGTLQSASLLIDGAATAESPTLSTTKFDNSQADPGYSYGIGALDYSSDTTTFGGKTWVAPGSNLTVNMSFRTTCAIEPDEMRSWAQVILNRPAEDKTVTAQDSFTIVAPAAPAWAVKKSTSDQPVTITGSTATTFKRTYTVTVSNTGTASGSAPNTIDTPAVPAGATIQSATVDGAAATIAADGTITIPGGQSVAPGASTTHSVVITYALDPAKVTAAQWKSLDACTTSSGQATSDNSAGVYNQVAFPSGTTDSDGAANNVVCTNVTGTPSVKIIKKINGDDADTAPGVSVAAGSTMDVTFEVTNTGNQPLSKVTVTDDKVKAADIVCDGSSNNVLASLAAGATVTCHASLPAPAEGQTHTDTGAVVGTPPANPDGSTPPDVTDDNPANAHTPVTPKFAIAKTRTSDPVVLAKGATSFTATYDLVVTNTSTADGNSGPITDAITVPTGFGVSKVSVAGNQISGDNGTYTISDGLDLKAGASQTITVSVDYSVDQKAVTAADGWKDVATCTASPTANDTRTGLFDVAGVNGDTDGPANNDACVPVTPATDLSVAKTAVTGPLTLADGQTGASTEYLVTITNNGTAPAASAAVTDTPSAPAGFTIASVSVDGTTVAPVNGTYQVTAGETVNPGAPSAHRVVVNYTVDQAKITADGWANLASCDANDTASVGDATKGLYNKVSMDGDNDTEKDANNDACVPVSGTPKFAVSKTTNQGPITLAKGDTTASTTYQVSVANTGTKAGQFPAITEAPSVPAGFTIASVTIDGTTATAPYTITPATLAAGETKTYTVVVNYTVDQSQITPAGWANLASCDANDATTDGTDTQGLYNKVTMDGDADTQGTKNNDACVPVQGTSGFHVAKTTTDGEAHLSTTSTSLVRHYTVTVTNDGTAAGTSSPAVTDVPSAPAGFTIASVTVDGTAVDANAQGAYPVTAGDTLAAGASKDHAVVITYAIDQAKVTDWASLATCSSDAATPNPAQGVFNEVTMDGDSDGYDNNHVCTPVVLDELKIVKYINGSDANTAPGVQVEAGQPMQVTYLVTNTGSEALEHVNVTDQVLTPAGETVSGITADSKKWSTTTQAVTSVDPTSVTLAPGEAIFFRGTAPAPAAGVQHTDEAVAHGTPPSNGGTTPPSVDSPKDPANAWTPAVEIVKKLNGMEAHTDATAISVKPGDKVTATFEVTNTSVTTLANVKVADKVTAGGAAMSDITCTTSGTDTIAALAAGETQTCTATFTMPAGTHVDEATATVPPTTPPTDTPPTPPSEIPPVTPPTPPTVTTPPSEGHAKPASIQIVKKIEGYDANTAPGVEVAVGSVMDITYDVTNTGQVPLTNVTVTDDKVAATAITCPKTDLAVGETMQCTATLAAPAAGVQHTNTGTVVGTPPTNPDGSQPPKVTDDDPANAHSVEHPSKLTVVKYINGDDANTAPGVAVEPGSTMQVTYLVTNTGETTLSNVNVTDQVTSPSTVDVDPVTIKGDASKWNTTTQAVSAFDGTLAPGEAVFFRGTATAPAAGVQHTDVAVAHGTPPTPKGGTTPPPVDSPQDPANAWTPSVKIVKKLNGVEAHTDATAIMPKAGDTVTATFEVTNTSAGTLNNVAVTDKVTTGTAKLSAIDCAQTGKATIATLAPGQTATCAATFVMPKGDHVDEATATGEVPPHTPVTPPTPPSGITPPPTPLKPPAVTAPPSEGHAKTPSVKIVKYINGSDANDAPGVEVEPGSTMTITYLVTNDGATVLNDVSVTDQVISPAGAEVTDITAGDKKWNTTTQAVSDFDGTLAPGEAVFFTGKAMAPEAGVQHTDEAVAHGTPPTPPATPENPNPTTPPTVDSPKDPANAWTPSLSIVKKLNGKEAHTEETALGIKAGDEVTATFEVTNTSKGALTNVKVTDKVTTGPANLGPINCAATHSDTIATLAAGATETCTATFTMPEGNHVDEAVATVPSVPPATPEVPNPPSGVTPPPTPPTVPPVVTPPSEGHAHNSSFSVSKATSDKVTQLTTGQTSLVRHYTVTVTSSSDVTATSPAVVDTPHVPTGFTITKVVVDGKTVKADAEGAYPVTAGDTLKAKASKDHAVVVTFGIDQSKITSDGWTALASCAVDGDKADPTKGLYNLVSMEGDSDGVDNNDACTPVTPPSPTPAPTPRPTPAPAPTPRPKPVPVPTSTPAPHLGRHLASTGSVVTASLLFAGLLASCAGAVVMIVGSRKKEEEQR